MTKILLAEDDDSMRGFLAAALRRAGHDVQDYADGEGALQALEREVSNVRRKNTPLCMALLDIDNFKSINDKLGHSAGDADAAQFCFDPINTDAV